MNTTIAKLLNEKEIIVFPGVYDPLSALIAKKAGFDLVFVSGYGVSAAYLGLPDLGYLNQTDISSVAQRICSTIDLPVIVDADTGYGNEMNVKQTVTKLINAGAKGCFLEDQSWPKRCGHMSGKEVIPRDEFANKLAAAVAAKANQDFFIVARTDAIATDGVDEAIVRMKLAEQAGVDGFFIEAPPDLATMQRVCNEAPKPLVANMIEGGKTPVLNLDELKDIGYQLVLYPLTSLYSATKNMMNALNKLQRNQISDPRDLIDFTEFNEIIGANDYLNKNK